MKLRSTVLERISNRVFVDSTGCHVCSGARDKDGYGLMKVDGKMYRLHRLAYSLMIGPISSNMCVLHTCDNPSCCNPAHLFLGTNLDNIADRDRKRRAATGDRNGARLFPGRLSRGEVHSAIMFRVAVRGDKHHSRTHPEKLRAPTGDRHGMRLHPEKVPRGEKNGMAKLSVEQVIAIRNRYAVGDVSQKRLADEFCVSRQLISMVILRKVWSHVETENK